MITDEIKNLSIKDRLILMEEIWETLCYEEDKIESPAWHKEVLDRREKKIENGEAKFISLEELKGKTK